MNLASALDATDLRAARPIPQGEAMLMLLAAAFAVVNGANDGGAMVATQLRVPANRPLTTIALLAGALAVVPLVIGTGVADTLTSGLIRTSQSNEAVVVATGVAAAIVVVAVLSRLGLPTSLTLGTVGGIVGAGLGLGLPVVGGGVGRVVLIGIAAPIVGALVAQRLVAAPEVARRQWGTRGLVTLALGATVAQAVAYAANDGQKMLAMVAVTPMGIRAVVVLGVAALFAVGAVVGLRAAAGTLSGALVRGNPHEEVTAQLGAAVAVLSSAALGVPVSMTQAVAGGLVGTGMLRGVRQVRWRIAAQLVLAWVLTLPSATAVGLGFVVAWERVA
jgi:PiT family inorganic phosphate transporter